MPLTRSRRKRQSLWRTSAPGRELLESHGRATPAVESRGGSLGDLGFVIIDPTRLDTEAVLALARQGRNRGASMLKESRHQSLTYIEKAPEILGAGQN